MVARLLSELRGWSCGRRSDDVTIVILRRRLTSLVAELRGLADEVLGAERAAAFWDEAVLAGCDDADAWIAAMPELLKQAQARFGRGPARELTQQLRLAIEDYR
jgi:hypothetical protein